MQYILTKGIQSNYIIELNYSLDDWKAYEKKALAKFEKAANEGDNKGSVAPEYLEMGTIEEAIHSGVKRIIDENSNIKFIGNIYDLDKKEKENGEVVILLSLDEYPECFEINKDWRNITIGEIDYAATTEDVNDTIDNLRKQYANYSPALQVGHSTVCKVICTLFDSEKEVGRKTVFLGDAEFDDYEKLRDDFYEKKEGDKFRIDYDEKTLPTFLHYENETTGQYLLEFEVKDIQKIKLPEFTEQNIMKFFGSEEVRTEAELREKVTELISKQKFEMVLMSSIDNLLVEAKEFINIVIPRALINEEMKTRVISLQERFGGKGKLETHFKEIGEERKTEMLSEISEAAHQSLIKFFTLKYIAEKLELKDLSWKTPLSVEIKVYEKFGKKIPEEILAFHNKTPKPNRKKVEKPKISPPPINPQKISIPINPSAYLDISNDDKEASSKASLFNFYEYIQELKEFEIKKEFLDEYEQKVNQINDNIEDQLWFKDYVGFFSLIKYNVPESLENDFNWGMLMRLVASSFEISSKIILSDNMDGLPEFYIEVPTWGIVGNIRNLTGQQILRLFEKTVEEHMLIKLKIANGDIGYLEKQKDKRIHWLENINVFYRTVEKEMDKKKSVEKSEIVEFDYPKLDQKIQPSFNLQKIPKNFPIPAEFNVTESTMKEHYKLVYLIINSKSLKLKSKQQYTLDLIPEMNIERIEQLMSILVKEYD